MDRRLFLAAAAAAPTVALSGASVSAAAPRRRSPPPRVATPSRMKLGSLVEKVDDPTMKVMARWGIKNIYARAQIAEPGRLYPTVDELRRMLDTAHRNGVSIDILRPVNLAMTNIDRETHPAIMLGESPQRDRDIEAFQTQIRNCAAVGIPAIRYTLSIVGNQRTGREPGRGDASYVASHMAQFDPNMPLTKAGRITPDIYWERITYFLDHVVPVANENKVRLLSHVEDAMVPPAGYQGIQPVTNTVEGAKKFVSIQESPYHGLLFCIGTFSEMLENPRRDIYDVIRWFGERKKIFMIDFRNIRGNRQNFVETFPDEGDIDMLRCMRVLKEVGYDGMLCPDHTPETPGGPDQVNAFQYGYIRGLLQAVDELV
jgi:mannonate dehydratase